MTDINDKVAEILRRQDDLDERLQAIEAYREEFQEMKRTNETLHKEIQELKETIGKNSESRDKQYDKTIQLLQETNKNTVNSYETMLRIQLAQKKLKNAQESVKVEGWVKAIAALGGGSSILLIFQWLSSLF